MEVEQDTQARNASRVSINALTGLGVRVLTMAVGFFLTPFIIETLGIEVYGLWAVIGSLAAYIGLLDLGVGASFVKFIAEFNERKEHVAARQAVTFCFLFYALLGTVIAVPVYLLAPYIVTVFKMPPAEYGIAIALLRAMYVLVVLTLLSNIPGMIVISYHRMDVAARNMLVGYVAYASLAITLLKVGVGLQALVISTFVQIIVTGALHWWNAKKFMGRLFCNPKACDPILMKRMLGFGGWTQVSSVFTVINLDIGRFIAAGIVSVASVGYYEIGGKLAFIAKSFPSFFQSALLPAAAAAAARGDEAELRRMYLVANRYQVAFACYLACIVVALADPIVEVWLGKPYPYVAEIVAWLCAGYAVSSVVAAGCTILNASGKPQYEASFAIIGATANVLIALCITHRLGVVGVAIATAGGWFAATLYFVLLFRRLQGWAFWQDVGVQCSKVGCVTVAVAYFMFRVVHQPHIESLFHTRLLGFLALTLTVLVQSVVFLVCTALLGVWAEDEVRIKLMLASSRKVIVRALKPT